MNLQQTIRRILREDYTQITKKDLLGKVMYHGTTLEMWEQGKSDYIFVTESIDTAKFYADENTHDFSNYYKKPLTSIIVKLVIDEDIMNMEWDVDDDGGRYTELGFHTWQDSYREIGTFIISGCLNIDKFPIVYRKKFFNT